MVSFYILVFEKYNEIIWRRARLKLHDKIWRIVHVKWPAHKKKYVDISAVILRLNSQLVSCDLEVPFAKADKYFLKKYAEKSRKWLNVKDKPHINHDYIPI